MVARRCNSHTCLHKRGGDKIEDMEMARDREGEDDGDDKKKMKRAKEKEEGGNSSETGAAEGAYARRKIFVMPQIYFFHLPGDP